MLPDTHNHPDTRNIPIGQAGIKSLRHPITLAQYDGKVQHSIARVDMMVSLSAQQRATHMSRFVKLLYQHQQPLSSDSLKIMLQEMAKVLNTESAFINMRFPYFTLKTAPVSREPSLLDHQVTFLGELHHDNYRFTLKVSVPVTNLCPCSKALAQHGAHNQRSRVTVTVSTHFSVWIEEMVDIVESQASSSLYSLIKRPDEKWLTEKAYDNPKFVEDLTRDVALQLQADKRLLHYRVESESFESIHNHSAYACIEHNCV